MRRIGVITGNRSEYGILRPLLRYLAAAADVDLRLYVTGAHLAPEFGYTVAEIRADGYEPAAEVEMALAGDTPSATAKSMAVAQLGLADVYARERPELLVLLGDRYEMLAAGIAALPFEIPLAHLHGGEVTEGAVDERMRHALTKLSHLHFAATEIYGRRLVQLGEEPWRVTVSGAVSLDNLNGFEPVPQPTLEERYGLSLAPAPLLVTYHATGSDETRLEAELQALFAALDTANAPLIFTFPNPDPGGRYVARRLEQWVARQERAWLIKSAGSAHYFSLMHYAAAMVGNSSSGIIEAASFGLPVVNIGDRQRGRVRGRNVIDVGIDAPAITAGLTQALAPAFQESLRGLVNPYGRGQAAPCIGQRLRQLSVDARLLRKRFHDIEFPPQPEE